MGEMLTCFPPRRLRADLVNTLVTLSLSVWLRPYHIFPQSLIKSLFFSVRLHNLEDVRCSQSIEPIFTEDVTHTLRRVPMQSCLKFCCAHRMKVITTRKFFHHPVLWLNVWNKLLEVRLWKLEPTLAPGSYWIEFPSCFPWINTMLAMVCAESPHIWGGLSATY